MSDAVTADARGSHRVERRAGEGALSDSEALAQAKRTIERNQRELEQERQRAETAEGRAAVAVSAAASAAAGRLAEREGAIKGAIEGAKKAEAAALSAKKSARAAQDDDAMDEADQALLDARVDLKYHSHQLALFEGEKPRLLKEIEQQAAGAKSPTGPSDHSKRWLAEHPKFYSDARYHADAIAAHALALEKGIPNGSQAYVDFLNEQMLKLHGKDHGKEGDAGDTSVDGGRRRDESTSSSAAPPNRDAAAPRSYRTAEGHDLRISTGADGKKQLSGKIPALWAEAATWQKMDPVAYAIAMIEEEEERRGGRGPSADAQGATYR